MDNAFHGQGSIKEDGDIESQHPRHDAYRRTVASSYVDHDSLIRPILISSPASSTSKASTQLPIPHQNVDSPVLDSKDSVSCSPLHMASECPAASTPPSDSTANDPELSDPVMVSRLSSLSEDISSQSSASDSSMESDSASLESEELGTSIDAFSINVLVMDEVDDFASHLAARLDELQQQAPSKALSPSLTPSFGYGTALSVLEDSSSSSVGSDAAASTLASTAPRHSSSHIILLSGSHKRSHSTSCPGGASLDEPARKRVAFDNSIRKISYPKIEHVSRSVQYAALEPASLRKSLSLLSDAEEYQLSSPLVSTTRSSRSESHASTAAGSQYDPTTSPAISETRFPWTALPYFTSFATYVKRTSEDVAAERMKVMLDRENHMRERDTALIRAQEAVATLELGQPQAEDDDVPTAPLNPWSSQYAIQDKLRGDCVKWILDVVPPDHCLELRDALNPAHSTWIRFHAASLFNQYLLCLGPLNSPIPSPNSTPTKGAESLSRDMACTCLALSIKYNRDVLLPLHPIYTHDFLDLLPGTMIAGDLESLHRDLLLTFDYNLGRPSPEAYMCELWNALPTLRALLSFDSGWKVAQASVWEALFDAIEEPDCIRFPIHTLTAAALSIGIADSLVNKYAKDSVQRRVSRKAEGQCVCAPLPESEAASATRRRRLRAARAARNTMEDILDLLGISQDELRDCRRWLDSLYC